MPSKEVYAHRYPIPAGYCMYPIPVKYYVPRFRLTKEFVVLGVVVTVRHAVFAGHSNRLQLDRWHGSAGMHHPGSRKNGSGKVYVSLCPLGLSIVTDDHEGSPITPVHEHHGRDRMDAISPTNLAV